MAVTSFILKKFAMSNWLMLGTDSVNEGVYKLGASTNWIIDYGSILNGVLPMAITEGLAALSLKTIKTGEGMKAKGSLKGKGGKKQGYVEYDLIIPHIIMSAEKINSDPLMNNANMDPLSVVHLMQTMYPDATIPSYNLAKYNPLWTFSITDPSLAYLYGDKVNAAVVNFNELIASNQGYFDLGITLANIEDEPYTLADYSFFCTQYVVSPDNFDTTANVTITAMGSVKAFDPDKVSDQLTRILPVVFGDNYEVYIVMTGEHISLKLNSLLATQIITNAAINVHPIAGWGAENSISDHAVAARHEGGGVIDFFKQIGKTAIPVLGPMLSSVADHYLPGSGGVVKGLGDFLTNRMNAGEKGYSATFHRMMGQGWKDPYNPVFRPVTNGSKSKSTSGFKTPVVRYY
jgi:hypothetical protein